MNNSHNTMLLIGFALGVVCGLGVSVLTLISLHVMDVRRRSRR